ncbi:MAG: preprotein translocase subunit YajC [Betaproteobacteria bacterium]|nr:preprotein translocase subunit YajC [Betaproteobacteria bacterium]MDE1980905.1 preprotein translocase subunit YajC [Betaproteobacteria bacterium]MDE2131226.1 preprotein translocase subunit YajC [Betaproteobacteria bacterium]MDE2212754.1 preprotein translocase subunit YajC [Betaproteobacteria bacterium]MDE2624942.1 preprotein translocase subunit YajC [Betaproteobacteria bacterium]
MGLIENAFADNGATASPDLGMNLIFIVIMFAVLYFMMIRPQLKRQKEQKAMLEALSRGDEVVVGGIMGRIVNLDANKVELEVAKGVTIQVQRAAVGTLLPKGTMQ